MGVGGRGNSLSRVLLRASHLEARGVHLALPAVVSFKEDAVVFLP